MFGVGFVLLTFGVAQLLGGSGFLAVYVAGIIIGNRPFTYRRNLIRFHDSLAWIAQVGMFLLLGLLVNPRELPSVMPMGLLAAFFLIFFSRPRRFSSVCGAAASDGRKSCLSAGRG